MNSESFSEPASTAVGETADVVGPAVLDGDVPQPLVRSREEHNISRRDIDPDALKVLYRLARNNYTAYLVGGGVRDLLLGRQPKDFDISTNARPEQIRALFRNCILIGRRFRLAHVRYGEKIIETSTFRRTPEATGDPTDPDADLFQRDDNLFGSPHEDARRRDFTVNGLFYDIESFSVIDYVGGMEDLEARRIRCIGDPCIRFREDPVRMVRAVRFASRLGFSLDPDTEDAIHRHGEELAKASPARLLEEITRLFAFSSGEKAVRLLQSTGLLGVLLPEVASALEDPRADAELFWNRLQALDQGDTVLPDATPALIFATLLLEPLKLAMGRTWYDDDFPRLKFDKVHAFLEPLSQRLRFPRKMVDRLVHIYIGQHRFLQPDGSGKKGSLSSFVTQESFHESLALAEILTAAGGRPQTSLNMWREMLAERIYGRDDNAGNRRHQTALIREGRNGKDGRGTMAPQDQRDSGCGATAPAPESDAASGGMAVGAETGDFPTGKKLSRSARRRRNQRQKKLRQQAATPEAPAAAATPEVATPVAEIVAENRPENGPSAKTRRRGRGRKTAVPTEAAPAEPADSTPFQPLTAADFYTMPPEPELPAPEPTSEQ
ncbi:MAG: polynucleotide adenylyltransferase PcnB [Planctomycetes bacterium]|nr:polynucleotide adenylyltransferase PcnB [Planctomycetota bacterium]